jgi:hypothetical protein
LAVPVAVLAVPVAVLAVAGAFGRSRTANSPTGVANTVTGVANTALSDDLAPAAIIVIELERVPLLIGGAGRVCG